MLKPGKAFHFNVTHFSSLPAARDCRSRLERLEPALYRCVFSDDRDDELQTDRKLKPVGHRNLGVSS